MYNYNKFRLNTDRRYPVVALTLCVVESALLTILEPHTTLVIPFAAVEVHKHLYQLKKYPY